MSSWNGAAKTSRMLGTTSTMRAILRYCAMRLVQLVRQLLALPLVMCLVVAGWDGRIDAATPVPPRSAKDTLENSHVRDGYVLELVAAEPMVLDPVAIDWGPDGRLWVAEMADYPYGMDGKGQPGGRVRFLEDTDQDGRYDRSTVFLDKLSFPNGVMAWRNGVLVTAAPELFYAEDTDGDGRADRREVLFDGFMQGNQQLRVNGLRWGLDNWVYCASGGHHAGFGSTNSIQANKTGTRIRLGSRDFRFRPDDGRLDPQSGPSQFGRVRDDWGNWFGVQNSHPLWHYVIPDHYLRRNRHIAVGDARHQVRWPPNPPVFPIKSPQKRFHSFEQAGHYTSACGQSVYRDELLFTRGDEFYAFTCEPFHNVVQRHTIRPRGVTFEGSRAEDDGDLDFFAAADRWCRPVMTRTGPDGALWIVDMYRYMIEHPDWLPPEGRDELRPFYRAGDQHGRIYRIYPRDKVPRQVPRTLDMSSKQLVDLLEHPNGVLRDQAHRLLVQRNERSTTERLQRMALESDSGFARLHALCVLDGIDHVALGLVKSTLKDPHPAVRRNAIRIGERHGYLTSLRLELQNLRDDSNEGVKLQLALSLGQINARWAGEILADLAADCNDRWMAIAICTSATPHYAALVTRAIEGPSTLSSDIIVAMMSMGHVYPDQFARLLRIVSKDPFPDADQAELPILVEWLDGLNRRGQSLSSLRENAGQKLALAIERVKDVLDEARRSVLDDGLSIERRRQGLGLLGRQTTKQSDDVEVLSRFLAPRIETSLQLAAIDALSRIGTPEAARCLLVSWRSLTPQARSGASQAVLARKAWIRLMLNSALEYGISRTDFDASQRARLLGHSDEGIANIAADFFDQDVDRSRDAVVQHYLKALKMAGNSTRGLAHFNQHCAKCHSPDSGGHQLGPDLKSLTDRSPESLLVSILDPGRAVEPRYLAYNVRLMNGQVLQGVITAESGNSMVMQTSDGKSHGISRDSIDELVNTRMSFMPDGFEQQLAANDMADLIAFVRGLGGATNEANSKSQGLGVEPTSR